MTGPLDVTVRLLPVAPFESRPGDFKFPNLRLGWEATEGGRPLAENTFITPEAFAVEARWQGLGDAIDWLGCLRVPVASLTFEVPDPAAASELLAAVRGGSDSKGRLADAGRLVAKWGCRCEVRAYDPDADMPGSL